jgi:hypothetical protein
VLDLLPLFVEHVLVEKHRHKLVAALADLAAHVLLRNVKPVMLEGLGPGLRIQRDRVDEGSVDVEVTALGICAGLA